MSICLNQSGAFCLTYKVKSDLPIQNLYAKWEYKSCLHLNMNLNLDAYQAMSWWPFRIIFATKTQDFNMSNAMHHFDLSKST